MESGTTYYCISYFWPVLHLTQTPNMKIKAHEKKLVEKSGKGPSGRHSGASTAVLLP